MIDIETIQPYTRIVLKELEEFVKKRNKAIEDSKWDYVVIPTAWYLEEADWPVKKRYTYGFKNPSFGSNFTALFVARTAKEMILLSELDGRTWAVPIEYAEWFNPV